MNDFCIKDLIKIIETIDIDQKKVEKKTFDDYLLDKKEQGKFKDDIISFDGEDDKVLFERLTSRLGITLIDVLTNWTI